MSLTQQISQQGGDPPFPPQKKLNIHMNTPLFYFFLFYIFLNNFIAAYTNA